MGTGDGVQAVAGTGAAEARPDAAGTIRVGTGTGVARPGPAVAGPVAAGAAGAGVAVPVPAAPSTAAGPAAPVLADEVLADDVLADDAADEVAPLVPGARTGPAQPARPATAAVTASPAPNVTATVVSDFFPVTCTCVSSRWWG